jgi:hypothetical protein
MTQSSASKNEQRAQDEIPTVRPPRGGAEATPKFPSESLEPPESLWRLWVLARDLMLAEADEALDRSRRRSD